MDHPSLLARARSLEEWVERKFVDPHGIVYSHLDVRTEAPLTEVTFEPGQVPIHLPGTEGFSTSDWMNYENCGMTTGAYLQAQVFRYEVEGDAEALTRARRCFNALRHVYQIGAQMEEGFFPKIYGGRFSEQTSSDQVLYAMLAFDRFHPHATDAEKREIDHMLVSMIEFWVKREYRYKYFWIEDMLWPVGRFTSLLLIALRHGGGEALRREYERLLADGVNDHACELQLAAKVAGKVSPIPYEERHHAWLIGDLEGAVAMDVMELSYLLEHDPENPWADRWRHSIREIWDEGALVLADDGTSYLHVLVDMDTGAPRRPEPEFFRPSNGDDDWVGFQFAAGARTGNSTLIARSAVQAHPHLRDPKMVDAARLIIRAIDRQDMLSYNDADRYPPQLQHLVRYLSGDAVTNWLWAYWQGRSIGVFDEADTCLDARKELARNAD